MPAEVAAIVFCTTQIRSKKRVLKFADSKMEGGAFAGFAFEPDFAIVVFYNFFANGEANSGTVVFVFVMKAFEHLENGFGKLLGYTDSVIMYRKSIIIK